jgi:hypothetical protein
MVDTSGAWFCLTVQIYPKKNKFNNQRKVNICRCRVFLNSAVKYPCVAGISIIHDGLFHDIFPFMNFLKKVLWEYGNEALCRDPVLR